MTTQPDARTCRTCGHSNSVSGGKQRQRWFRICERERPFRVVRDDDPGCEHYEARGKRDSSGAYYAVEDQA